MESLYVALRYLLGSPSSPIPYSHSPLRNGPTHDARTPKPSASTFHLCWWMVSRKVRSPLRFTTSYLSELSSFSDEPSGTTPSILLDSQVPRTRDFTPLLSAVSSIEIQTLSPKPPRTEKSDAIFSAGTLASTLFFFGTYRLLAVPVALSASVYLSP